MGGRILEVLVTAFALAFRESKGYGDITTSLQALSPEGAWSHLYGCEGHRGDGIAGLRHYVAKE